MHSLACAIHETERLRCSARAWSEMGIEITYIYAYYYAIIVVIYISDMLIWFLYVSVKEAVQTQMSRQSCPMFYSHDRAFPPGQTGKNTEPLSLQTSLPRDRNWPRDAGRFSELPGSP